MAIVQDCFIGENLAQRIGTYWKVQALLSVTPGQPRWEGVYASAVNGSPDLPDTPHRLSYALGKHRSDSLEWDDETVAKEQFALLMKHEQRYRLRLIRVMYIHLEDVV